MGKKVTFPLTIGPTHPAFKEPLKFNFEIDGEKVVNTDIDMGYTHRAIEWVARKRNFIQIIYLVERICGICSITHPTAYVLSIENAVGIEVPPRAKYIRSIVCELERLHSHLLWAGVAAHEIGFDTIFYFTWNIREKVMDCLEILTGNRVTYAMQTIGGVRRDITEEQFPIIQEMLDYYKEFYQRCCDVFFEDLSIRARLEGVGVLPYQDALDLCAVGPTARGSGVKKDVRVDYPMNAYADMDWLKPVTPWDFGKEPVGDIFDRTIVRVLELKQSMDIIEYCLENMPDGDYAVEHNPNKIINMCKKAEGIGIGRYEGPRGEAAQLNILKKQTGPYRMKMKASTYSNIFTWPVMLQNVDIADIPITIASIDPCISCSDRMSFTKDDGTKYELTASDLHKLSIEKQKEVQKRC